MQSEESGCSLQIGASGKQQEQAVITCSLSRKLKKKKNKNKKKNQASASVYCNSFLKALWAHYMNELPALCLKYAS